MWLNQLSRAAPCQCLTPAGITTTVPGVSSCGSLPHSWYQPRPSVQTRICPPPFSALCTCQLLRQPGSKVTLESPTPHSAALVSGLRYELPTKNWAYVSLGSPRPNMGEKDAPAPASASSP